MNIQNIIDYINPLKIINNQNVDIKGLSYNSKTTKSSDIFVCLEGEHVDGHQYAKMAEEKGASAILAQKEIKGITTPVLLVKNTQLELSRLANLLADLPSKELEMIGVTGTNGKTTVTHLIERIFQEQGINCGLIGTLGQRMTLDAGYSDAKHTTPQAPELQQTLRKMIDNKLNKVVMEVSSHSLEQHRVGGCEFKGAVLTNLTQDHLDFHITMDNYLKAKCKLFEMLKDSNKSNKYAVINNDDKYAKDFTAAVPKGVNLLTYSIENHADIMAKNIEYSANGCSFQCSTPRGEKQINLQMTGQFSVYNALAALCAGIGEGIDLNTCVKALESTKSVAGRFETVAKEPLAIVDYAHTPDGLENVLTAAKKILPKDGELICVFGCGGDRDATKRPQMASIADRIADKVIITSDNPRSEDPQQIITDILTGIKTMDSNRIFVEIDRRKAIEEAIKLAHKQDIVVVAGKGHEDYQILKDETIHFDDREEVLRAFKFAKA